MGIAEKDEVFEETTPEHEQVLDYMNSAAWEARLAEARAKRERVLAAREATQGSDQIVPEGAPAGMPLPFGLNTDPDAATPDPDAATPDPDAATPDPGPDTAPERETASPEPAEAAHSTTIIEEVQSQDGRHWTRNLLDATILTTAIAAVSLALVLRDPGGEDRGEAVPPPGNAAPQASEPSATPDPASRPAAADGRTSLAGVIGDLGPDYDVRVIATSGTARPEGATFATRSSRFAMQASTVSFFHSEDEAAAIRLSERIDAEVLDLTGLRPSPPPGTIDVHLAEG